MKTTLPNLKKLAGRGKPEEIAESEDIQTNDMGKIEGAAEPKPPPPLSLFFMLSHLEDDGPVRLDGVKLAVLEVMGLELDEPKLGAFAGSLNALDFPVQLLVRQHPPVLQGLRNTLAEAQPEDLPQQTRDAADSLGRLLTTLENREGILDRRFYAVCEHNRADELRALLVRAGVGVFPLNGQSLKLLLLASALGGSPTDQDEDEELSVEVNRRDIRVGDHLVRSLHLGKWPRSLAPGFLQGLMAAGAPMDLAVHLGAIPSEQAARTLEWQKVRFESAQSLSLNRGRSLSPEAEIALEDVSRLRDEVQRGRERLFHASLSVTLHAADQDTLKDLTQKARAHFAATLGKLDNLAFRQREGLLSTLPLALNAVAVWRTLDTSSLARLFPFSPPDLDTRSGTLYGIDLRACAPIVYDPFGRHPPERQHCRPGKVRQRQVLRHQAGRAAGHLPWRAGLRHRPRGRVRRHGPRRRGPCLVARCPRSGHEPLRHRPGRQRGTAPAHRQPAAFDRGDGGRAAQRRAAGPAWTTPWLATTPSVGSVPASATSTPFLSSRVAATPNQVRGGLSPTCCGPSPPAALRHLLSDEGDDLLTHEALVTVFDLHLLEPELRPAAAMVCTETVWAAAAQDPPAPPAGGGRGLEHHAAPRGRGLHGQRGENAPASTGWVCSSSPRTCRTCSARTLPVPSLDTAAGRYSRTPPSSCCSSRTPPPSAPWAKPFDLPPELQRWLLSCPRGDGLLLARGNRFPVRIEATPEETEVIEWRPGPRH